LGLLCWYPITPSSSLAEALIAYIPEIRTDEEGDHLCAVIQAEDELAAAGMVVGGGWSGIRAMTATSGPGISLMSEFIGLAYFAEIPCVIWDINAFDQWGVAAGKTIARNILKEFQSGRIDERHDPSTSALIRRYMQNRK